MEVSRNVYRVLVEDLRERDLRDAVTYMGGYYQNGFEGGALGCVVDWIDLAQDGFQ